MIDDELVEDSYASMHKKLMGNRASPTTHKLEWLEHSGRRAELELKLLTREFVYVWNTNVTQNI